VKRTDIKLRLILIKRLLQIMHKRDLPRLLLIAICQLLLAILDLVGVAFAGIIGAIAVDGIRSTPPSNTLKRILSIMGLADSSLQRSVLIIGLLSALFLVAKTYLAISLNKRILLFFSLRAAKISGQLVGDILSRNILRIKETSTDSKIFSVTTGVNLLFLGVIATSATLLTDISLLIILGIGLFAVNPLVAAVTFFLFGILSLIMFRVLGGKIRKYGKQNSTLSILSSEKIREAFDSYKEIFVRGQRQHYVDIISKDRAGLAAVQAEMQFLPLIGKYLIEGGVTVTSLLVAAIAFAMEDATHAVTILTIFLAAGTRIAPAILRVQQGALQIKGAIGQIEPTLILISESSQYAELESNAKNKGFDTFIPSIEFKNVSFKYPDDESFGIENVSLQIKPGQLVAFVGPSGAGKTTLADLMLGILTPNFGEVLLGNLKPQDVIQSAPGVLGYVSQDIHLSNATFVENISQGFPLSENLEDHLEYAILNSQLKTVLGDLPQGLLSKIGENGSKLSGGQRQRLGIARALYSKPKILVLDEATSALDAQTENEFTGALHNLHGSLTVVVIAHRLSTVRKADVIFYLEKGKLLAEGSFEQVRSLVPNFDTQARLMGN
jgi:ABC-type multidrug transport system fused ATPase/permease subunit